MPDLHPTVVHFPIALLMVAFAFDVVGSFKSKPELLRAGWWCQVIGCIFLAIAVSTGLIAKNNVSVEGTASSLIELHEQMAFVAAGLFAILILWRVGSKSDLPQKQRWIFWLTYTAAIVSLATVAFYGGEMVFQWGIGVRSVIQ